MTSKKPAKPLTVRFTKAQSHIVREAMAANAVLPAKAAQFLSAMAEASTIKARDVVEMYG